MRASLVVASPDFLEVLRDPLRRGSLDICRVRGVDGSQLRRQAGDRALRKLQQREVTV
jgi:hypothetical protein